MYSQCTHQTVNGCVFCEYLAGDGHQWHSSMHVLAVCGSELALALGLGAGQACVCVCVVIMCAIIAP